MALFSSRPHAPTSLTFVVLLYLLQYAQIWKWQVTSNMHISLCLAEIY